MPNHCSNQMLVRGEPEVIARFKEQAHGQDDMGRPVYFDISKFIPMPEDLRGTRAPNTSPASASEMRRKYGQPDWYEWANAVWGTKWGTYDTTLYLDDPEQLGYAYQTAWSPLSDECIGLLAEAWPTLSFEVKYAECGIGYYGLVEAGDGAIQRAEYWEMSHTPHDDDEDWDGDEVWLDSEGNELDADFQSLANSSG